MPTKKILTPLLSGQYFHIYNKGNDGVAIFYSSDNYMYFMKKYKLLLGPYLDTFAYCLLPNHFHFLVRVKSSEKKDFHLEVSHQFRRLFQAYALSINKQEGRSGSLFRKHFRRIHVDSMDYLRRLVFYIHFNPQKHQILQNFRDYPHSSYGSYILGVLDSFLEIEETVAWFNDIEDFVNYHDVLHNEKLIQSVTIEDE